MRKIVLFLLILFSFAPPFIFGFVGGGLLAPLGWSAGMALFAVGTGWRAPEKDIPASLLIGFVFAATAHLPVYFIGRWLGNSASRSIEFTSSLFLLALLIFGSLAVVRSVWPQRAQAPAAERRGVSPMIEISIVHRLMEDEKAQVERLPEPLRSEVRKGANCDRIAGAVGEFGRDPRNPIPVNGPLGAMVYLSNLRTAESQKIMFHRLGSVSNVDIYETVSFDATRWDILFLHQYHPRKSKDAPTGYQVATGAERNRSLLGICEFLSNFPNRLPDAIAATSERFFGIRIRPAELREVVRRAIFVRPTMHVARLDVVSGILKRQQP